jgi:hypothetical protein
VIDLFAEQNVKFDDLRADVRDMNTKIAPMAIHVAALRKATLARWVLVTFLGITALAGLGGVVLTLLVLLHVL